jgi:hypothetical protein
MTNEHVHKIYSSVISDWQQSLKNITLEVIKNDSNAILISDIFRQVLLMVSADEKLNSELVKRANRALGVEGKH